VRKRIGGGARKRIGGDARKRIGGGERYRVSPAPDPDQTTINEASA
jgi:hypothetical protein